MKVKIWLDDVRPRPFGYIRAYSVNQTKDIIESLERQGIESFELDLDHDLGDYAKDGGDGYKLVEWLIETDRNTNHYVIQCHSMNPIGREHILGLRNRYWKS